MSLHNLVAMFLISPLFKAMLKCLWPLWAHKKSPPYMVGHCLSQIFLVNWLLMIKVTPLKLNCHHGSFQKVGLTTWGKKLPKSIITLVASSVNFMICTIWLSMTLVLVGKVRFLSLLQVLLFLSDWCLMNNSNLWSLLHRLMSDVIVLYVHHRCG